MGLASVAVSKPASCRGSPTTSRPDANTPSHAIETGTKGLVLSTAVTNKPAQTLYESCGWQRDDEFFQYHLFF